MRAGKSRGHREASLPAIVNTVGVNDPLILKDSLLATMHYAVHGSALSATLTAANNRASVMPSRA